VHKASAVLGSAVFFALAPCAVAGLGPYLITGWRIHGAGTSWAVLHVGGGLLLAVGATVLLHSVARFVTEGLGTPAPIAPTQTLVVGGLYRYIRNPMYVAIDVSLIGQSLLFGRLAMLWYTTAIALGQAAFVRLYEQPALAQRYGTEYERYRAHVPAWLPRLRPWRGGD
jgi:protein-S-isoprenylcysteine O-methyltransferase Ste14